MAIKGKKSRSKPKATVRAPRHEVVELPTPFLQRRLVQMTFALVLGLLIFWCGVWLTNGLRSERLAKVKSAQESKQRLSVQSWKGTVDSAISNIGTEPTGPGDPAVFTDLTTATAALAKGDSPSGLADTLSKAKTNAVAAKKALDGVDISQKIVVGKGFDVAATNYLIGSKSQMLLGLDLYAQSIALVQQAADASGAARTALANSAGMLQGSAASAFSDGWGKLQEALAGVGIFPQPPQAIPGAAGGLGGLPGA